MKMRTRSASSVETGLQWTDQLAETIVARETEVRESAVLVDVMTAARNQTRMKQTDVRQLRTEKRIIGKPALRILCYRQAAEGIVLSGNATEIVRET
jgi:hypothetical protein